LEDLSLEHVVPLSLGGRVEIPSASCKKCRDITSQIEMKLARNSLHVHRAVAGFPSRRKKRYPTHSEVILNFVNRTKSKRVPIQDAPLVHILPIMPLLNGKSANSEPLYSCSTFQAVARPNNARLIRQLKTKYSAQTVTFSARAEPKEFFQLIWKIASGFFWLSDQESYLASDCQARVLKAEEIFADFKTCNRTSIGRHSHAIDLFSIPRHSENTHARFARADVYSDEDDRFLFCEIDMLAPLGFPIYVCRIPIRAKQS
jgi:hypothetical protein